MFAATLRSARRSEGVFQLGLAARGVNSPCEKIVAPSKDTERKPHLDGAKIKIVWKVVQCNRRRPSRAFNATAVIFSKFRGVPLLPMTVAIAANEKPKYLI